MTNQFYQVMALFDDGECISYILIGNFTKLEVAEMIKSKWDSFFEYYKSNLFSEPKDWDPSLDEWCSRNSEMEWTESRRYYELISQYDLIKQFVQIDINPMSINGEVFLDKSGVNVSTFNLMTQWDRDFKLKEII